MIHVDCLQKEISNILALAVLSKIDSLQRAATQSPYSIKGYFLITNTNLTGALLKYTFIIYIGEEILK